MSAFPSLPASLADAYMDCLTIDSDGDIIAVNVDSGVRWRRFGWLRAGPSRWRWQP
jgi:hypothetical protein